MFVRLWAAIRSFFGLGLRRLEDPEVILRQYVDDIRARVPRMNQSVVEVMKVEVTLRGDMERLDQRILSLDGQVIAAVKLGPQYENDARTLIGAMEQAKQDREALVAQHESAARAVDRAKEIRAEYLRAMDGKCQEAMRMIAQSKQARMQEELANTMTAFEVGDTADTLERVRAKLDDQSARAQARLDLATHHPMDPAEKIRRAAASMGVDDKLQEYKRNLGLAPAAELSEPGRVELPPASLPQERKAAG